MSDKYLIHLPSWTTTKEIFGMKITYINENNEYRDEIIIPGLVTKDIKLVVRNNTHFKLFIYTVTF